MDNQVDNIREHHEHYDLVPPDGGWGWFVLFGCVLVNFLLPGTIKSFGVLFIEFLEVYEFSEVTAPWIPALCYFLYCSLGPVSNYLSSKYSFRTVTLIGGTFAVVGLILSSFATSLIHLCITYGFLFGTGTGLSFPAGIFIVTSYFQKFRGLANGIAISGSAFGSMVLPPLLRYLLENYGINGAVLIMSAITMNVWVGALLYHPVTWHLKRQLIPEISEPCLQKDTETYNTEKVLSVSEEDNKPSTRPSSLKNKTTKDETTLFYSSASKKVCIVRPVLSSQSSSGILLRKTSSRTSVISSKSKYNSTSTLSYLQPLEFASQVTLKSITESIAPRHSQGKKKPSQLVELLQKPVFITIIISNATTAIGYTNFAIFLPVYAISLHYDKTASSLLLSVVAFFDLIGRIGGSCITDFLPFSKRYYYVMGLIVSGISLVLLPLAQNYTTLCCICAIFGLSSGIFSGVVVVYIVEELGEDKLASSYTIILFINGILQLIGPPACGLMYQYMKSFEAIICALGLTVTFGGLIWIIPLVQSFKKTPTSIRDKFDKTIK